MSDAAMFLNKGSVSSLSKILVLLSNALSKLSCVNIYKNLVWSSASFLNDSSWYSLDPFLNADGSNLGGIRSYAFSYLSSIVSISPIMEVSFCLISPAFWSFLFVENASVRSWSDSFR